MKRFKQTSRDAVRTQSQSKLLSDRKKIIAVLKRNHKNGCTRGELAIKTGIAEKTVTWRIRDLILTGQVYVHGTKLYPEASQVFCEAIFWNFESEELEAA